MWTNLTRSFSQMKHWQSMALLLQNNRISQVKVTLDLFIPKKLSGNQMSEVLH